MLRNKIYQNFFIEIIKTFLIILLALSMIALTVRAVSFLDLIVDNGYPVATYMTYSLLNLFGIAPKFIPLSFLLALTLFIIKHLQESEFVILWTSGLKKIHIVNLFFFISLTILFFYLILSTFLTPLALNKSRQLLSYDNLNSFLPTIKKQQFSDSFKSFTFIVEKKINNEVGNIFLHDTGNNLKNLSTNSDNTKETTIIAENGLINKNRMILFNGQIISTKKNFKNEMIKFDQLSIDLKDLNTTTIKKPKIQETPTLALLNCFLKKDNLTDYCNKDFKKEILSTLNRRITLPFFIPVISLICALLLVKSKKLYFHKVSIFFYSFMLLLVAELAVRLTGKSDVIFISFLVAPFALFAIFYFSLNFLFSEETKKI